MNVGKRVLFIVYMIAVLLYVTEEANFIICNFFTLLTLVMDSTVT